MSTNALTSPAQIFSRDGCEGRWRVVAVLDTPSERFTETTEPRTQRGDVAYAKRLAVHTRMVKFFVNVEYVDVVETVLSAYLYADGRTALEALSPGWLTLDLDPRRPPRPTD